MKSTLKNTLACFALLLAAAPLWPAQAVAAPLPRCNGSFTGARHGLFSGGFDAPKFQHMASYCFDEAGMFTVVLDDGSIWQQWADDVRYAYWRKPAAHYTVLMLGDDSNGQLTIENDGLDYRVRRIG